MGTGNDHITVCICTYKRPELLKRLLVALQKQEADTRFTYSITVVDNDAEASAQEVVNEIAMHSGIDIHYSIEPEQNIALARNRAIENSQGEFIAFIDDDEFPADTWLKGLYEACYRHDADGILGPVRPYFEENPPQWIVNGKFYEKQSHETGFVLSWQNTRTSNVLLKRSVVRKDGNRFKKEFGRGGEDRDFFRRMIEQGYVFIWTNEAFVYEIIPKARWKRSFMVRRALLRGRMALLHPSFGYRDVLKSVTAVFLYTLLLPVLLFLGQHIFMKYVIKDFDHIGKLLALMRIDIIRQKYVME